MVRIKIAINHFAIKTVKALRSLYFNAVLGNGRVKKTHTKDAIKVILMSSCQTRHDITGPGVAMGRVLLMFIGNE